MRLSPRNIFGGKFGGGADGASWKLRDYFTTDLAAGSVNGTTATPLGGVRTLADTASKVSIVSGVMLWNGGKASPAIGDPKLYYGPYVREEGLTFIIGFRITSGTHGAFGFCKNINNNYNTNGGFRIMSGVIYAAGDTGATTTTGITQNANYFTYYKCVIHTVGYTLYISVDGGYNWTQVFENTTETFTPLYLISKNYNSISANSFFEVFTGNKTYPSSFTDYFERANTTAGTYALGTAPNGFRWTSSGSNLPFVNDGFMKVTPGSSSGYALIALPNTPTLMTGKVTWVDGTMPSGHGATFISSYKDYLITDVVHTSFNDTDWSIKVRTASGAFITILNSTYDTPLSLNIEYTCGMSISGDTCTALLPDGTTQSVTDARIGALKGKYCIYELGNTDALKATPQFSSVHAEW
jgi:hypothetical protein